MNKYEKKDKKRPLSHNPLINFSHEENFLYSNPKFMNEELWRKKYNLKKLHEKWERKVKTNFLSIDLKFGHSKNKNNKLNQVIYNVDMMEKIKKIPNLIPLSPLINNKSTIMYYDKYNDKISYYLSHKNPWNNKTAVDKNYNIKNIEKTNIIKNDKMIGNKLKNSNEAKNIIISCKYYNKQYLEKREKLKELIKNYANEMMQIVSKKYEKEIKLKGLGKQKFKNFLIFQDMITKYKKLYHELNPNNNRKNISLKRCKSDINLHEIKMKNKIEHQNIFKELYIIINYLKENKEIIKTIKEKEKIIINFFDVIEKDEYLRDKNVDYQKYILNFGKNIKNINNNSIKKENENNNDKSIKSLQRPNLLSSRRKNVSCYNLKTYRNNKQSNLEYKISFYPPGTYFLFKKDDDEDEYHAWSCCMNEKKTSQGCCKKIEKIPIFNYDIIV